MWISNRRVVIEAAVAGAVATGAAVAWSGTDPWLATSLAHPGWIAVLALAAFYGLRGLLIGLVVVWGLVAVAGGLMGSGLEQAAARATGTVDVLALAASLVVAGICMAHARAQRKLADEVDVLRQRAAHERAQLDGLAEQLDALGARHDRVDLSVTYWRDIAGRLEGDDTKRAAQAALELCLQRTGARAGIVRRVDGGALCNVAWRGRWSPQMPAPRDIFRDHTMSAAIERCGPVLAEQVDGARAEDTDLAVPIVSLDDGRVIGVIGLRGLSRSRLRAADIRDVTATAQWLAAPLAEVARTHDRPAKAPQQAVTGPGTYFIVRPKRPLVDRITGS